jgi:hypothetical protein
MANLLLERPSPPSSNRLAEDLPILGMDFARWVGADLPDSPNKGMPMITPTRIESKADSRHGATAVEFAVAISIFIILVLGIVEIGRGFMVTHLLANAARNGCRTGILASSSNTDVNSAVDTTLTNEGLSGATTTIKVNGVVADVSTAQSGDQITVVVSLAASRATWLPGAHILTGNLSGEFALRRE